MAEGSIKTYSEIDKKIRQVERLAEEVRDLGAGLPVVEKNSRSILCSVEALRYGISDLVGVLAQGGEE